MSSPGVVVPTFFRARVLGSGEGFKVVTSLREGLWGRSLA